MGYEILLKYNLKTIKLLLFIYIFINMKHETFKPVLVTFILVYTTNKKENNFKCII